MITTLTTQVPILKWPGNKNRTPIADRVRELYAPYRDHLWIEPFVGAAGMLLAIEPERALCGDASAEVIGLHQWIQDGGQLISDLFNPIESEAEYYVRRDAFNRAQCEYQASPDFIDDQDWFFSTMVWLNKNCFNGLWRTNYKNMFNVPVGRRSDRSLLNPGIPKLPTYQHTWLFAHVDFEFLMSYKIADTRSKFVYLDPPYHGTHTSYVAGGFNWAEQERLAHWAASLNCPVVLSNSSDDRIVQLYNDIGFHLELIEVKRSISRDGDGRSAAVEVLARNFKV